MLLFFGCFEFLIHFAGIPQFKELSDDLKLSMLRKLDVHLSSLVEQDATTFHVSEGILVLFLFFHLHC